MLSERAKTQHKSNKALNPWTLVANNNIRISFVECIIIIHCTSRPRWLERNWYKKRENINILNKDIFRRRTIHFWTCAYACCCACAWIWLCTCACPLIHVQLCILDILLFTCYYSCCIRTPPLCRRSLNIFFLLQLPFQKFLLYLWSKNTLYCDICNNAVALLLLSAYYLYLVSSFSHYLGNLWESGQHEMCDLFLKDYIINIFSIQCYINCQ